MATGLAIAVTNVVVGKLVEIVAQQVVNEASLVRNFQEDFEWLQTQLTYISDYLQAADEQTALNASVKQWLSEVSDIALDAEDIVDECAVQPLYVTPTQSCFSCFSQSIFRRKMGKRIQDLKGRMSSSIQKAGELNLVRQVLNSNQASSSTSERERGMTGWTALEEDSRAVAVEEKVEEIERLLEDPEIGVLAVVGMAGLGKTFLLKNVYDRVEGRYEHSAWISVSQTYSLRNLQSDLASNIELQMPDNITDFRAAQLIQGKMHGKSCFIVLDDVWRSSVDGDLLSRLGLPTGRNNQCKIVVTTRSRDVAANMNAYEYEMQRLSKEDSWKLFCLLAFPGLEENRPPEHLESVAHKIAEECGRLPLAVKTVAASMARCSDLGVWQSKLRKLKDVTVRAEDPTMQILKLSYHSLPPYLKACFAYLSFFPEDTAIYFSRVNFGVYISQEYLIYLWISEGFIPQEKDIDQYDKGLIYLRQLENLCLLDVDRVVACYSIHDSFLDLIINISREQKCEFDLPVNKTRCRRLLLPKKGISTNLISESSLHHQLFLRTLSFFQNPEITSIPEHLFDGLKVLRVLDLSSTAISTLPKCVGKLKILKVLNLSNTKIREVPDCVRRLKSLEYLDVSNCTSMQHARLPDWIGELKSLCHLDVRNNSQELTSYHTPNYHMPKRISNLMRLRTLRSEIFTLTLEDNEFVNVKDVGNLINLQEINFCFENGAVLRSLQDGIFERLVKMRPMGVKNKISAREGDIEESTLPAFPEKMNVIKDLQVLGLVRFSVPSWICGMLNLRELILSECSDYPSLQNMPYLQTLMLFWDSRCRELARNFGESGGFPRLVRLYIADFPVLEELPEFEEGSMPRLEVLGIQNCPQMKKVPKGLERLRRLKVIKVYQASADLKERLKEGGEDWKKIKAKISNIQIIFAEHELVSIA